VYTTKPEWAMSTADVAFVDGYGRSVYVAGPSSPQGAQPVDQRCFQSTGM
jgi:hypothetical protein